MNEERDEPQVAMAGEQVPQESQRNLPALLLSDANTIGTTVEAGVATAAAVKKVLAGKSGQESGSKDGGDQDGGPAAQG